MTFKCILMHILLIYYVFIINILLIWFLYTNQWILIKNIFMEISFGRLYLLLKLIKYIYIKGK